MILFKQPPHFTISTKLDEAGPMSSIPAVHLLRSVGTTLPAALLPSSSDVGGWGVGCPAVPMGMAGLEAMALARTNLEVPVQDQW